MLICFGIGPFYLILDSAEIGAVILIIYNNFCLITSFFLDGKVDNLV
jgi:hypothetical protein